jgi:cell division control protein 45
MRHLLSSSTTRLMLFRHWTLFDAFCYSPYVAPRLQTWRPGGKEAVSLLFANMGVSIEQAKTDFSE